MGRKSNDNRVIEVPVQMIADVKALLSEAINTLSGLCSSSKINIFAKYKPVKWSGTTRSNTWWKSVDQNCGINLEPYDDLVEMTNDWYNVEGFDWRYFWKHVPPTGGGTYPYRLLDFNNYRHTGTDPNADKPFTGYRLEPQVIRYLMDGEEALVGISPTIYKRTANDTYLLQLSDISVRKGQGLLNLNNTYFGIAIMQEGQVRKYAFITGYYKFNENVTGTDRMDNSIGYNIRSIPTIGHDTLPANGDYYVFPFLSESRLWSDTNGEPWKMKERESFATGGLFIPLPYYGQKITVVKQTPLISLVLQAYQTKNDKVRLNITATNNTNGQIELPWRYLTYHYTEIPNDSTGQTDYSRVIECEGTWEADTVVIPAGGTAYGYKEFDLKSPSYFGRYGGYISDIRVWSSYGYIDTPVSAPNFDWIKDDSEINITNKEDNEVDVGGTLIWYASSNKSDMRYMWSVEEPSIASISYDDDVCEITGVSVGTAWIRCSGLNYDTWDIYWVNVVPGSGGGSTTIHVISVELVPSEKTIKVNEQASFAINFNPPDCSNKNVRWWSDNPSIASVDANTGQVTGKSVGLTWINVETVDGRKTASAKIIVNPNSTGTAVTSVAIDYVAIDILTGSENAITLTATVYPTSATNKNVTWSYSSGGGTYVTLTPNGLKCTVTGKAVTSTPVTITVKTQDGNYTATCKVNVYSSGGGGTKINVTGISLDKTSATAYVNRSIPITATVSPPNATDKTVVWQSSDTNVATVDQQGNVSGVAVGQCQIAAKATNGTSSASDGKTAVCYITVEQLVTGITLSKYSLSLTLGGQHSSETIQATISPSNATNKALNWRSTYPEIADVQSNGLVIAKGIGVCNIWVEAADGGGASNVIDVEVTEDGTPAPHIRLESVDIKDSQGIVRNGQTIVMNRTSYRTEQLSYVVTPNNATDLSIGWSSRSEGVATVSLNGLVTVVAAGETIIDLNINGYDSSFASNWVKIKVN